jgi:hypothetical protein
MPSHLSKLAASKTSGFLLAVTAIMLGGIGTSGAAQTKTESVFRVESRYSLCLCL